MEKRLFTRRDTITVKLNTRYVLKHMLMEETELLVYVSGVFSKDLSCLMSIGYSRLAAIDLSFCGSMLELSLTYFSSRIPTWDNQRSSR